MMNVDDVGKIVEVLEAIMQYELLLSDFYKCCADVWTEDEELWKNLSLAEIRHGNNIQKMKDIIVKKQGSFTTARPFNLIALNTVSAGLKDNIRRLTLGDISREKALIIARNIEQSIIESNYVEIVKTDDIEYNTLMKDILSQTHEHKKIIQEKIEEIKAKA
jgi:hypothetical protein